MTAGDLPPQTLNAEDWVVAPIAADSLLPVACRSVPASACRQPQASSALELSTTIQSGCVLVGVRGALDRFTAATFSEQMRALDTGGRPVLIDASELDFLDGSGIYALVTTKPQGHPALICPRGNILRVLGIVKIQTVMNVYASVEEAIAAQVGSTRLFCLVTLGYMVASAAAESACKYTVFMRWRPDIGPKMSWVGKRSCPVPG